MSEQAAERSKTVVKVGENDLMLTELFADGSGRLTISGAECDLEIAFPAARMDDLCQGFKWWG